MRNLVMMAAALSFTASACAQAGPGMPDWMVGAWCTAPGDEQTCERWTADAASLRGTSQYLQRGKAIGGEKMRLVREAGQATFFSSPDGAPEVAFRVITQDEQSIEFGNDAHDYPQRIRYWRDGANLRARISAADGSKAMDWEYRPAG